MEITIDFIYINKYNMNKNIYLYSFTYPRSAQCIKICRVKYQ